MSNKLDKGIALGLSIAGIIQLISLFVVFLGFPGDVFTRFIYNAFSVGALYIPALYGVSAYLIIKKPLNKEIFYYAIASVVLFFPASTLLKIIFSKNSDPVIDFFHSSFDRPGRSIGSILVLLLLISILLLSSRIIVKHLISLDKNDDKDIDKSIDEIVNNDDNEFNAGELNSAFDLEEFEAETNVEPDYSDQESFSVEELNELDDLSFEDDEEDENIDIFDQLDREESNISKDDIGFDELLESDDLRESDDLMESDESETPDEDLSFKIDEIRNEIKKHYQESSITPENIPFKEPDFPEASEVVDIDAYDESNRVLSSAIHTELSTEEYEFLKSFEEEETFNPEEEISLEEDPALDFLSSDSEDFSDYDGYNEYEEELYTESYPKEGLDLNKLDKIYHSEDSESAETQEEGIGEEILDTNYQQIEKRSYEVEEIVEDKEVDEIPEVEDYDDDEYEDEDMAEEYSGYDENYDEEEYNNAVSTSKVLMPEKPTFESLNQPDNYNVPINGILEISEDDSYKEIDEATKRSAAILEQTLEEFNIKGKVTGIKKGPVITMFELLPAPGVKLSKIVNLSDNIALGLAASTVRIVAPIPGKHAVGIEVPNKKRAIVNFSELIDADEPNYEEDAVPIILGKSINGDNKIIDLAKTPHLLIAGATGAGKSVCVNSLICSILCKRSHNDVKMIMVDPKIVELKLYNGIPHLLTPVITDPKKAYQAIQWCLYEMERRYALLDAMGVRDIKSYNKKIKKERIATTKLPYLVLIVDEFADLMATSGKELEGILARLAAMSRAVGIHLVLATQRPSIDVITGLIKANFPSRIAFMVSSKTDSRIILDGMGAEKLLGRGDMLFTSSWDPFPVRIQGSFLSDEEVESVVDYVKGLGEPEYIDDEIFMEDDDDTSNESNDSFYGDDPLFNRALEIVINAGKASASFLQRRLKIGYNRAARLVEEMEERGIIGPQNGSKPREILRVPDSHKEVEEFV